MTVPVVTIAGLAIVVDLVLVAAGRSPHLALVAALCALVGVAIWAAFDVLDHAASSGGVPMGRPIAPDPRADRRVARLRSGLAFGRSDDGSFEILRGNLIELVDGQLRAGHDLDIDAGTDTLRPVIGDRLVRLIGDPATAQLLADPGQLDRILSDIECL